jgi:hypothetical protein
MLIEASVVISLILVPLLLGVTVYGFNLIRILQANQINRDAGHMFARGVDLSGDATGVPNQFVLTQMAPALKDTSIHGNAVLILSAVEHVGDLTCPTGCTNKGFDVFTQQIVIGNKALHASIFGTVQTASFRKDSKTGKPDGTGVVGDPLMDGKVVTTNVKNYITLTDVSDVANGGYVCYIAETYFSSALSIPGFPSPAIISARAFF